MMHSFIHKANWGFTMQLFLTNVKILWQRLPRLPQLGAIKCVQTLCAVCLFHASHCSALLLSSFYPSLSTLPWVTEHIVPSFRRHALLANAAFSSCCVSACVLDCSCFFSSGGDCGGVLKLCTTRFLSVKNLLSATLATKRLGAQSMTGNQMSSLIEFACVWTFVLGKE